MQERDRSSTGNLVKIQMLKQSREHTPALFVYFLGKVSGVYIPILVQEGVLSPGKRIAMPKILVLLPVANMFSGGSCVPYRSKGYNRRGDHSWARMEPGSQNRTLHKLPCASHVVHARDCLYHLKMYGERRGTKDNDQADSSDLFAGRTLVHRQ